MMPTTYTKSIDQAAAARARWNGGSIGGRPPRKDGEVAARFDLEGLNGPLSLHERAHDVLEDIRRLASTWTHDPEALRRDRFIHQRRPARMPANALRRLHGG